MFHGPPSNLEQVDCALSNQEHDSEPTTFHREGDAVVFDKPPSAEEASRKRREDEQHEFARAQVDTNRTLAWFTGALVVATFCTIGVGVWQATISRTAANAARDAVIVASNTLTETQVSNGRQATLTDQARKDSNSASESNQKESDKALQAAIDNFHQQQRAWIAVVSVHGTKPELNKPFSAIVDVKDTGLTPAKNVITDSAFAGYPKGMPVNFDFGLSEHKLGILSPGGDRAITSSLGDSTKGIDQASVDQFAPLNIYVYGIIRYDDIYGFHHWITYCSQLSDDRSQYNFCEQHNDTDDSEMK
jgi:hypothetical protein